MPIQPSHGTQLAASLFFGGFLLAGCAGSKDSTPSSFDMSEYRQMMERQKGAQGSLEDPTPSAPEMTAEEHERAGDMDAQRHNFPLAGVHYSKALKADPTRNSVRLKLGQIFLQQGMFEPALTQFQDLRTREPNSAPAHQGIGHVYLLQGKLREAERRSPRPSPWIPPAGCPTIYSASLMIRGNVTPRPSLRIKRRWLCARASQAS